MAASTRGRGSLGRWPTGATMVGTAALGILALLGSIHSAKAQCSGTETFEKLTGFSIAGASQTPLFASAGNTVTAECNNRCRASKDCLGFLIDYRRGSCSRVESNSADIDNRKDLREEAAGKVNLFQKVCLQAPACEKAWIFERVPGYELAGYDHRITANVVGRVDCEELCLKTEDLPCRSAEYVYKTRTCRMSKETRRTQPASYRATTSDVDYLENQCSKPPEQRSQSCDYLEYENQELGYADLQLSTPTKEECQTRCDEMTAFNCRSYSYTSSSSTCRLSGDDTISTGPNSIAPADGTIFYQKAPCVDPPPSTTPELVDETEEVRAPRQLPDDDEFKGQKVSLACTATSMTVTLNTDDVFKGKLFAYLNPRACVAKGKGKRQTSLTFQYEDPEEDCGVERAETEGAYTTTVVVQHHPIIQQKGDRAIRLYCYFDIDQDKVVTNSYDIISETVDPRDPDAGGVTPTIPGIPTSIVNGTAPQPSVILRIVNSEGEDITGTKLGEPLFIRIEIDGDSIFDIFARNLIAESGLEDEEIKLLDDRGCPTDPVFPGLQKDPETGALLGRFEAFKFSDTTVVNFQVNVQFCQDRCNPVDCGDGVTSYGKRRKRQAIESNRSELPTELAERLVFDPELNQEVIRFDLPLKKQIRVEIGTEVEEVENPALAKAGNGVFVAGNYTEGDVFCASWTVMIVTASSFVFLQFCILVVCVLCIYASRRKEAASDEALSEPPSSITRDRFSAASRSGRSSSSIYHSNAASSMRYRSPIHSPQQPTPPPFSIERPKFQENSASTLRSLRTSLRD